MTIEEHVKALEAQRNRLIAEARDDLEATQKRLKELQQESQELSDEHNQRAAEREEEKLRIEGALRLARELAGEGNVQIGSNEDTSTRKPS